MTIRLDRERFVATMKEQAEIGATDGGGLHRLTLSDDDKEIRDWFAVQMEEEGLDIRIDEFGNMFGRREGTDPDAKPVLVGSHLDSQPYGGIYDGALGVIGALELIRTLNDEDVETTHPVEIVNWTNEEGSRFQPAMQGSGVWAGAHSLEEEYAKTDADGKVFEEELDRIGYRGDVPAEPQEAYEAYLELHVEQGPYLEENGKEVGVVTGIVGFTWGAVTFYGEADHSGPTPMHYRKDALVAAADVITQIRRIPSTLGERTVGTTGYVDVKPNSINIIPDEVTFTWGFRDPSDDVIEEAYQRVLQEAEWAAEREGIDWEWEERMRAPAVEFADQCVDAVQSAADALELDSMRIFSGAGHDATHMHSVCDTGMVFAPSENGKSHNESEYTSWDDCYAAASTLANAAVTLAGGDAQ
ncbi:MULTISPECIES: Zn-dependent hydrolase [Haloferax]|uniref:Hydantoinase/carbamoylase family amidase n=2 Tax=Haloferax TaxID=2251 RepID=A0A6G1Z6K2_9EURY|nr:MULTISPECIES: Zn-dependent hydrolase [Haloferax]KAB1185458.1 Zn-dependent hydrolase [Haloferax sp. CBA1149]MRW82105.1 hydantoinase/carbamoylase family amidase [Haloferax marinisediminis]